MTNLETRNRLTTVDPYPIQNTNSESVKDDGASYFQSVEQLKLKKNELITLSNILEELPHSLVKIHDKLVKHYGKLISDSNNSLLDKMSSLRQLHEIIAQLSNQNFEDLEDDKRERSESIDKLLDISYDVIDLITKLTKNSNFSLKELFASIQVNSPVINKVLSMLSSDQRDSESFRDFWQKIVAAITSIKTDLLDPFMEGLKTQVDLFAEFNKTIGKAVAEAVSAGSDGTHIKFNGKIINQAYADFRIYLNSIPSKNIPNWQNLSQKDKDNVCASWAPAFKVDNNGVVTVNMDMYENMPSYPSGASDSSTVEISIEAYQVWMSSYNAVSSSMQNNMQTFAQRVTQMNATFDNIVKVLSTTISEMTEIAKGFLKI